MSKNFNVGLIGYGIAGQVFHASTINCVEGFRLKKIRETKPENIKLANKRYPEAEIVSNSEAIILDDTIDLVVIATPNSSHFSLAKQALNAGKNVVVDKPFTIYFEEAQELIALARQKEKLLSVYQNRRFDSTAKTVKKVIDSGMLGTLVEYEAHYDRFKNYFRPNAWREEDEPGSGIFYDLGAHLIDNAQMLFGLPNEITADLRVQRPGGKTIDNFELILNYPNLKVTLKGGMLVKEPGAAIALYGINGSFVKYGMDVQEDALRAGIMPNDIANWGVEPASSWGKINTEHEGLHLVGNIESETGDYREYYQNIYQVLAGKEDLIVKPEQSANTIRIIELAIQSSLEKRTVKTDSTTGFFK
ncbi:MAG: Gfo/Idh/MocA family oxidoreductase [Janthinobacterium lividum]